MGGGALWCRLYIKDFNELSVITAFTVVCFAFVVVEVIFDNAASATIIAEYKGALVIVLGGHRLIAHEVVDLPKIRFHIRERAHTKRTLIAAPGVILKTLPMHGVAASHKDYRLCGGKQVDATDRTVGMQGLTYAAMTLL